MVSTFLPSHRMRFITNISGLASGSTIAVLLRILTRVLNGTTLAIDDLCISVALLPLWGQAVTGILLAKYGGLGLEKQALSPQEYNVFYKSAWASNLLYPLAITMAKFAVLLLYRRVFTVRRFRLAICVVGGLCLCWFFAVFFVFTFQCIPVYKGWDPDALGSCLDLRNVYYGVSASNALLDLVITIMPVRAILKLKLPLKQRIMLLFIMCFGFLTMGAAVIGRIYTIPELMSVDLPATVDVPYMYTVIEPALAITTACLPTYRPIFTWLGATVRSSLGSSRSGSRSKPLFFGRSSSRSTGASGTALTGDRERGRPAAPATRAISRPSPCTLESAGSGDRFIWHPSPSTASLPPPPPPPKDAAPLPVAMPPDRPASPLRRSPPPPFPPLHVVTTPGYMDPGLEHVTHMRR